MTLPIRLSLQLACLGGALLCAASAGQYTTTYIPIPEGHTGTAAAVNAKGEVLGTECDTLNNCTVFFWSPRTGLHTVVSLSAFAVSQVPLLLNDHGEVPLALPAGTGWKIYLWSERAGLQQIAELPVSPVIAGVNNRGEVAGTVVVGGKSQAFVAGRKSEVRYLGTLVPEGSSEAKGISHSGMVMGLATAPCASGLCSEGSLVRRTFVWTEREGMRDLRSAQGSFPEMLGQDMNDRGEVAGIAYSPVDQRAFLWSERDGATFFSCLGRCPAFARINERGEVIGWYIMLGYGTASFLWTENPGTQPITGWGGSATQALDVNMRGEVVGFANGPTQGSRPFYWSEETGIVALAESGGSANSINDHGVIAGTTAGRPCIWRP